VSFPHFNTYLKGQCHKIFCFRFFPQAPENNSRVISNFFENSLRYSQVKVHHGCQRHGKFATGVIDTGGKWPPVSTTPAANLPPDRYQRHRWHCRRYQRHRRQIYHRTGVNDTGGKFATGWQIMGTILGCRHLKVNLKAKIYIYVNSTTQRCPNKINKIFLLEDFFHLPPVSLTPVVHLEPRISLRVFEKIRNGRNAILRYRTWGKQIHEKNQMSKIS
jgi:hypothetical protein